MTPVSSVDRTLSWYVRAVQQVGFPILVAAIVLWFIVKDVPGQAAAASRDSAAVRAELAQHRAESQRAVERISLETTNQSLRLTRIMQQICVNTAQSPADRLRCFPE